MEQLARQTGLTLTGGMDEFRNLSARYAEETCSRLQSKWQKSGKFPAGFMRVCGLMKINHAYLPTEN
jgi:hypothetical protein